MEKFKKPRYAISAALPQQRRERPASPASRERPARRVTAGSEEVGVPSRPALATLVSPRHCFMDELTPRSTACVRKSTEQNLTTRRSRQSRILIFVLWGIFELPFVAVSTGLTECSH